MTARKINTNYWAKPIPMRQYDWTATFDGYEENGPIGFGCTKQEAINDLLQHEAEEEDAEFDVIEPGGEAPPILAKREKK